MEEPNFIDSEILLFGIVKGLIQVVSVLVSFSGRAHMRLQLTISGPNDFVAIAMVIKALVSQIILPWNRKSFYSRGNLFQLWCPGLRQCRRAVN